MTSLRKRLNNVLTELDIIRRGLDNSSKIPPCCITAYKDGKLGCDVNGPLPPEKFLEKCRKCRMTMKQFLKKMQ